MENSEFALFKQSVEARLNYLQDRIDHVVTVLDTIAKLREDHVRMVTSQEARAAEVATMWRKLDTMRDHLDNIAEWKTRNDDRLQSITPIKEAVDGWRHQLSLIVKAFSVAGALIGSILLWTYNQLAEVKDLTRRVELVERVHQLDPAARIAK